MKSLAKIREKKPEIYNPKTHFFEEEYETTMQNGKKTKNSSVFYKDMVREDALNENRNRKNENPKEITEETPVEEQIRLKKEFKMAADIEKEEDNFFSVKTKTEKEIEDESFLFDKFLKEEAKKNKPEEVEMLKRFWGNDSKLDETDKFLRKYIMTKGCVSFFSFFLIKNIYMIILTF